MIKTGRDYAIVTVQLRNRGIDAYRPDVYGKSIVIERRLVRTGSGGYKVKSIQGKTISSQLREVKQILSQFNIQIDNPTTIMTQDISRKFLAESSGSLKYTFFLRATQLQFVLDLLKQIKHSRDDIQKILEDKESAIAESKRELDRLEAELREAEKMEKMEDRIRELNGELAWSITIAVEERIKKQRVNLQRERQELEAARLQEKEADERYEVLEAKRKELLVQVEELNEKMGSLLDESRKADDKLQNERRKQSNMRANMENILKKRISSAKQHIHRMRGEVEELRKQEKRDNDRELQILEERLQQHKESYAEAKSNYSESLEAQKAIDKEVVSLKSQIDRLTAQHGMELEHIAKTERHMRSIIESRSDRLKLIHSSIPQLLQSIERQKSKFHKPPIGPLGYVIKLKDNRWNLAAEHSLRSILNTFIVHDMHDQQLLNELIRRSRLDRQVSVIISAYADRMYNITRPDDNVLTLSDLIEIDWPFIKSSFPIRYDDILNQFESTVLNVLVDQSSIERLVLLPTRDESNNYLKKKPRNVSECFTLAGEKLFQRGNSSVTISFEGELKFFVQDVQGQLEDLKRRIVEAKERISRIDETARDVSAQFTVKRSEAASMQTTLRGHHQSMNISQRHINDITAEINLQRQQQQEIDNDEMIRNIEDRIREKEEEIQNYQSEVQNVEEQLDALDTTIEDLRNASQTFVTERTNLQHEHEQLSIKMDDVLRRQLVIKSRSNQRQDQITKIENGIFILEESIKQDEIRLEQLTEAAGRIHSDRIEMKRPEDQIRREIEQTNIRISEEQKRFQGRSVQDIKQSYIDVKNVYQQKSENIRDSANLLKEMSRGLKWRYLNHQEIQTHFQRIVSSAFNGYLSQRGHSGSIKFDKNRSTLTLNVHLDGRHQGKSTATNEARDVRSLSGGEKSFSTVSFLLALWEVVESPFRALDEFDIFMDSVYRTTSMDLLIKTALTKHKKRQLLILTPHDTSFISGWERVKIIRLKNPNRSGFQTSIHSFVSE